MRLPGKLKQFFFVISRIARGQKLPAKRRNFHVLGTVESHDGEIPAVLQNISETGLCFVIREASLPEEFMMRLDSPLERKNRKLRCRRVWAQPFEAEGQKYIRVGSAFNEHAFRLHWLNSYLTDDFKPVPEPENEAA